MKKEIILDDDDPTIVGLMIDYLYQMDYDDLLRSNTVSSPTEEILPEPSFAQEVSPLEESVPEPELLVAESVSYHGNFGLVNTTDIISEPEGEEPPEPLKKLKKTKKTKKKRESGVLNMISDGKDIHTARLTVNALVYATADKYEIDGLKDVAKAKFEEAVLEDWKSPAFAYAAELVFSTTPSSDQGLRSIVIDTINKHRELVKYEEIQNLLDSGNGMAWAFVQVLLSSPPQSNYPSLPYKYQYPPSQRLNLLLPQHHHA